LGQRRERTATGGHNSTTTEGMKEREGAKCFLSILPLFRIMFTGKNRKIHKGLR